MRQATSDQEFQRLVDAAREQGWKVEKTEKNHWRFLPPDRKMSQVIAASTPSDHRWLKNLRSHLRQRGLQA